MLASDLAASPARPTPLRSFQVLGFLGGCQRDAVGFEVVHDLPGGHLGVFADVVAHDVGFGFARTWISGVGSKTRRRVINLIRPRTRRPAGAGRFLGEAMGHLLQYRVLQQPLIRHCQVIPMNAQPDVPASDRDSYTQVTLRKGSRTMTCWVPSKLVHHGAVLRFRDGHLGNGWVVADIWSSRVGAPEREWLKHRSRTDVKKGTFAK